MSPAPFSTSTWISHGFGSVAACATTGSTTGRLLPATAGTSTNATSPISAAERAATPTRRATGLTSSGRGDTGRPASARASRGLISSAAASRSVASIA